MTGGSDAGPAPVPSGASTFTDEFLDGLRLEGDPPADAAVRRYLEGLDESPADPFAAVARSGAAGPSDEDAPGTGPFVRALEPWPEWADRGQVERGQQVFGIWGLEFVAALWMAALPTTYACAFGAEPLVRTARLTRDPKRRYVETGQMIIDAMAEGALDPGGPGYSSVRHVRLMHAAVRRVLTHPESLPAPEGVQLEPWDPAYGIPLNQEDLLGCLFAFSVLSIRSLEQSGVLFDDSDAEAYVHVWNLIGYQIGIRPDLLPIGRADAMVIANRIFDRQKASSDAGRELTATAITCLQGMLVTKRLRGLPASGMRHFLGGDVADMLDVPAADWTRSIFTVARWVDAAMNGALRWIPGHRSLLAGVGRHLITGFEALEQDGGRTNFEISDELRSAWRVGRP